MNRKTEIAEELALVMPKIARSIVMRFSMLSHRMPPAQIFTVLLLHDKPVCRFAELIRELNVSAPTATGIIDRLARQKLVKRIPDKEDRRSIRIGLTAKGGRLAQEIRDGIKSRWKHILDVLEPDECETYLKIVKRINEKI